MYSGSNLSVFLLFFLSVNCQREEEGGRGGGSNSLSKATPVFTGLSTCSDVDPNLEFSAILFESKRHHTEA